MLLGLDPRDNRIRCFNPSGHSNGDAEPSLRLLPEPNRFKCHVCGLNGDLTSLVKCARRCDYPEAVQWIRENTTAHGVATAVQTPSRVRNSTGTNPDRLAVLAALKAESSQLGTDSNGGSYLEGRYIDVKTANRLRVTEMFDADEVWRVLNDRFTADQLRSAGVMTKNDRFLFGRHLLLFWYFHADKPVYVQARDTTGSIQPKELSLAGDRCSVLYNAAALATPGERIVVCEGCIDTLSAEQMGHRAVGVPGVTGFRDEWIRLFRGWQHVVIAFDNDNAGIQQSAELRDRFRQRGIRADAVHPATVNDLNDLLQSLRRDHNELVH